MNNDKEKVNDSNNLIRTIIACLFGESDLKISSERKNVGELDNKTVYKVRIDYINQLTSDIVSLINMDVSTGFPGLEKYVINKDEYNNIDEIIKWVIINDKKLKNSLTLMNEYVFCKDKNIDLDVFTGKDATLIWLVKKIKWHASELISKYDLEGASKSGPSK